MYLRRVRNQVNSPPNCTKNIWRKCWSHTNVKNNKFLFVIHSWSGQTNESMYKIIFKNSRNKSTCTVYFYRQVKYFIKRVQNNVVLYYEKRDINSQDDCIKIHSLVLYQLSAPIFNSMIRYAWYACGIRRGKPVFKNLSDVCFSAWNFKHLCM